MSSPVRHRTAYGVLLVVAAVMLTACGGGSGTSSTSTPPPPARQQKELTVNGVKRSYRVFAPPNMDRRQAPQLIIVLGGVGNSAESMVGATESNGARVPGWSQAGPLGSPPGGLPAASQRPGG